MSENEIENERLYDTVNIVGDILYVNNQTQEKRQGLKILILDQIHNRLPISLAQLQVGIIQKNLKVR